MREFRFERIKNEFKIGSEITVFLCLSFTPRLFQSPHIPLGEFIRQYNNVYVLLRFPVD